MTKSSKIILGLDADGVLLNYLHGFISFCRKVGVEVTCEAHEVDDWSMANAFAGKSEAFVMDMVARFSVDPDFASIPVMNGAVEAISSIKAEIENIEVVAVTSAGTSEETIRFRQKNLESFPFDDIHVLPLGASKKEHLAKFPKGSVFVDDLYKHVEAAESVGVRGVLFRQLYNAAYDHTHVIDNWHIGQETVLQLLSGNHRPARTAA